MANLLRKLVTMTSSLSSCDFGAALGHPFIVLVSAYPHQLTRSSIEVNAAYLSRFCIGGGGRAPGDVLGSCPRGTASK